MERQLVTKPGTLEAKTNDHRPFSFSHEPRFPIRGILHSGKNLSNQPKLYPAKLQTKLAVSQPGDPYEKEADRVAEQVMRMPDPVLQRRCAKCDKDKKKILRAKKSPGQVPSHTTTETVMRRPTPGVTEEEISLEKQRTIVKLVCPDCDDLLQAKEIASEDFSIPKEFESRIESLKTEGLPLPESVREFFEPKFGYDFSRVKIHTDTRARNTAKRMNALAYTTGSHIVFAPGQFAPHSYEGKKLLAHELTHVVQQSTTKPLLGIGSTLATNQEGSFHETRLPVQSLGSKIGIHMQAGSDNIFRHKAADCLYEECCNQCRKLPNKTKKDKARRALCWSQCMAEYASCLSSSEEAIKGVLTGLAIAGAIALASADGPLPFGDAAAVGLLGLVGINLTD